MIEHPFQPQPGSNMCVCGEHAAARAHSPNPALVIRDRDQWNEHLANEVCLLVLAVPRILRGPYLRRVARLRRRQS